jgi:flagellar basal-body rod modification protein FlgD
VQPAATRDSLTTKDTFLKLLVAQLQNQNPLSPADGVEFLSQLTEISGLEQSIEMRQGLESMQKTLSDILDVQKQIQNNTKPAPEAAQGGSGSANDQ